MLEDGAQGQLHAEGLAHPGDELGGHERMPAHLEEVVVEAHPVQSQQFGHDGGQLHLGFGGRSNVFDLDRPGLIGRGQGLAIDLVAGGKRHSLQMDEGVGDHVLGQTLAHKGPQVAGRGRIVPGHIIGRQHLIPGLILPHDDHALGHLRMGLERSLDLAQLDAEAPHFDLMIDAAQELNVPAGQEFDQITGTIKTPGAFVRQERIGNEFLRCKVRPMMVAHSQSYAADEQFARHAHGQGFAVFIHYVKLEVADGLADGRALGIVLLGIGQIHGGADRGFGGAVSVEELAARRPFLHEFVGAVLTRGDEGVQRGQIRVIQHRQQGGWQGGCGDAMFPNQAQEIGPGGQSLLRGQHQRGAVAQSHHRLPHRGVEAEGSELQHSLALAHVEIPVMNVGQVAEPAMPQQRSLGATGGTRGVDDVGKVVGREGEIGIGVRIVINGDISNQ